MKLILERFRQFEKDLIKEKYRDTWSHSAARKGRQQMRPVSAGGEPVKPHLKNVTQTIAKHVLMMVDPTGVSAYPDVADSYKDMTKDPSLGNVSLFALNAISAIPLIGLIGKPFKALTIAKKIAGLKKARKTLKGTTELVDSIKKAPDVNQGLVTKLDDALKKAEETLVKAEEIINAKKWKDAERISSQPTKMAAGAAAADVAQTAGKTTAKVATKIAPGTDTAIEMSIRALQGAFKEGIVSTKEFTKWWQKINPNASRAELIGAWEDFNKIVRAGDPSVLAGTDYLDKGEQLFKVFQKYNIGVDDQTAAAGYVMSLAASSGVTGKYWDDAVEMMIKTGRNPAAVAADIAIAERVMGRGGANMVRAVFHEIGHVTLLKNSKVALTFLNEYGRLVAKRIKELERVVAPGFQDMAKRAVGLRLAANSRLAHKTGEAAELLASYKKIVNPFRAVASYQKGAELSRAAHKLSDNFLQAVDLEMMKRTQEMLIQASSTGDVRRLMKTGLKDQNYAMFSEIGKEIRRDLVPLGRGFKQKLAHARARNIYLFNFEEAFAELFEKTVRKVVGARGATGGLQAKITSKGAASKSASNFPETAEMISSLVKKEIAPLIKEVLLKLLKDHRYLLI